MALIDSVYNTVAKGAEEQASIATGALGFTWQSFQAVDANDFDEIFARLAAERFDAAYVTGQLFTAQNATRISELALRHRIPTIGESAGGPRGGLLLSYGQDYSWNVVRSAGYLEKILRGAKPSDLPVEQPTKLELVVNLKTAKALGLTVPPSLIARAAEVINETLKRVCTHFVAFAHSCSSHTERQSWSAVAAVDRNNGMERIAIRDAIIGEPMHRAIVQNRSLLFGRVL